MHPADEILARWDGQSLRAVGGLTSVLLYALRTRPVIHPGVQLGRAGLTLTLRGTL